MLGREFYEEVTEEEIEAIKRAMLGGRGGIASHSGHWYNCVNGHPVSLHLLTSLLATNCFSSLSASVECPCNSLVAQNVVLRSAVKAIR